MELPGLGRGEDENVPTDNFSSSPLSSLAGDVVVDEEKIVTFVAFSRFTWESVQKSSKNSCNLQIKQCQDSLFESTDKQIYKIANRKIGLVKVFTLSTS